MKKSCALWDLDGTLLDSKQGITYSIVQVLKAYGYPMPSKDRLERAVGPTLRHTFTEIFGFDGFHSGIEDSMDRIYAQEGMSLDRLFPGAAGCLLAIQKAGGINCVATMKPHRLKDATLRCHPELCSLIDEWQGWDLSPGEQKKSGLFRALLQKTGAVPEQCVAIGDRASDILAAKELGILSIAVRYGFAYGNELQEARPDYFVASPWELKELLQTLF